MSLILAKCLAAMISFGFQVNFRLSAQWKWGTMTQAKEQACHMLNWQIIAKYSKVKPLVRCCLLLIF